MLFIIIIRELAVVAQVVEYVIGNDEVPSSSLGNGTLNCTHVVVCIQRL